MVPVNAPSSAPDSAPFIVTIDGPAASGKSSVSREVAKRVGWSWVSTGAFYRGLAYIAYAKKSDLKNEPALVELDQGSDWAVRMTSEQTCVFMGTKDVTDEIGKEEVGSLASKISSFPRVRAALLDAQRQCAVGVPGLVAEGRDCGTVVFPDAQVKIFLTARAEDRAQRRAVEEGRDVGHIVKEQQKRDAQDANRKAAPLQAPEDAHVIDTTDLSFMEVVERVEEYIAKARQR
jgi:cytidylate kinase